MDDGRKTSASAIRRSALPRFAACLAVVGCAPRGAGATCVSPGTSRCAAWNAAGVGDYDYECPSTAVLELFSASSAIFLLDPYTQAADDGCMYDWSGRGHHAGLSDVNVPGETAVAPAVTSETLTSGVAAAYYRFDGETNYAPLAGPTYSTVGELTDFTFVAWVWTDHYSVTASDDSNWAIVDFDRSEYVELACCFRPLARCRHGVAQRAAGVTHCVPARYWNVFITGDGFTKFSSGHADQAIYDTVETTTKGSMSQSDAPTWHMIAVTFGGCADAACADAAGVKSIWRDGELSNADAGYAAIGTGDELRYGSLGDGSESTAYNGERNEVGLLRRQAHLTVTRRC
jgi:hypothetical protein